MASDEPGFVSIQFIRDLLRGVELRELTPAFVIDLTRSKVETDGTETQLSLAEARLLTRLLVAPGAIVRRDDLANYVAERGRISRRTVDALVGQLRQKFGSHAAAIRSHYGAGYSLKPPPDLVVRDFAAGA